MEMKIEKNVPMPKNRQGRPRIYDSTLLQMQVGDSILLPKLKANALYQAAKRINIPVSQRWEDSSHTHIRTWRV